MNTGHTKTRTGTTGPSRDPVGVRLVASGCLVLSSLGSGSLASGSLGSGSLALGSVSPGSMATALSEEGPRAASAHRLSGDAAPGVRAADVAEVHAELEALREDRFREHALLLLGERPAEAARAIVLRAGSDDPPGVSGARAERRKGRRDEGLALIREDLSRGGALTQELRALLALPFLGVGEEDLVAAATRVVARLELRNLTLDLAWNLRDDRPAGVREAAQLALRDLYGRWFPDREAFDAAWPELEGRDADGVYLETFRQLAERDSRLLSAAIAHELELIEELGIFETGPPDQRALAARELVRAVRLKELPIETTRERLRERLEVEIDPIAFQAALEAELELLQGQSAGAAPVEDLRAWLSERIDVLDDEEGMADHEHLAALLAQALARLPWESGREISVEEAASVDGGMNSRHVLTGLSLVARVVGLIGDTERPVDYDRLSLAIESLRFLTDRSSLDRGERRRVLAPASSAVVDLALETKGPLDARLDAAKVLDDFLRVTADQQSADMTRVLALLAPGSGAPSGLRLHLLAAIERLIPELGTASPYGASIQQVLTASLGAEDVDLRRRALEMLAGESLAPFVDSRIAGDGRSGMVVALLEGFETDPSPRNQEIRLELLRRFAPDPALALQLGRAGSFDELVSANGRGVTALIETVGDLAHPDASVVMVMARRFAASTADELRDGRKEQLALRLVTRAGPSALEAFTIEDRTAVLRWALGQRMDRTGAAPLSSELLATLISWVAEVGGADLTEPERTWSHALFLADLAERQSAAAQPDTDPVDLVPGGEVRAAFETALVGAGTEGAPSTERVRLARARYLSFTGEAEDAVLAAQDFTFLLEAVALPDDVELLLDDVRKAARAYADADRPVDAARAELRLIRLPAWEAGPQEEALDDLERLVDRARAIEDAAFVAEVRARLEELADTTTDSGSGDAMRRILEDEAASARFRAIQARLDPPPEPDGEDQGDPNQSGGGLKPARTPL